MVKMKKKKNRQIFTPILLPCFPRRYKGPFTSIDIDRKYQNTTFKCLPMQQLLFLVRSLSILECALSTPPPFGVDLHEHSGTRKITNFCSILTKLSINEPPFVISGWEECADEVIASTWAQTIVMLVILISQKDKFCSSKSTMSHCLAELSNQMPEKCYRTSVWVYSVRMEASLSSLWSRLNHPLRI